LKKKQEFHRHKVRFTEIPRLDHNELKERTIIALDRLGHQRFSSESGGYSLENWLHGVNILLDDFEEKIGRSSLSSEYVDRRRELTSRLTRPADLSVLDNKIAGLKTKEAESLRAINDKRAETVARVAEIHDELGRCSAELSEQKGKLGTYPEKNSGSLFRRLLGQDSTAPNKALTVRVSELESTLAALNSELAQQKRTLKAIDSHSDESPVNERWVELEKLRVELKELEDVKLEKTQLAKEREEFAATLASTISRISPTVDERR
jgi:uncharacterized small protein (DUF1192 family)